MTTTETLIPAILYESDGASDSEESNTVVSFEDFGDDTVGFHIRPYQDDTITLSFSKEDAWRFMREFAITISSAELS